jgi:hypothetical protein
LAAKLILLFNPTQDLPGGEMLAGPGGFFGEAAIDGGGHIKGRPVEQKLHKTIAGVNPVSGLYEPEI